MRLEMSAPLKSLVAAFLAFCSALLLAGPSPAAEEPLSAAFIYVGPVGDSGWTHSHELGRQCLEAEGVKTTFVESVPERPAVAGVARNYIRLGYDLIFATAFGYQPFTQKVAREYPDKFFFGITPTTAPADNILNYYGKLWDGRYLTGLVAGSMTVSNIIGFVAAHPIPTVLAGINAFALGVREANPEARIKVVWTNSWYDPAAERKAALALIAAGADVLAQHQDNPTPVEVAAEKDVWAIGSESDMRRFAPERYLTGTIWNWCPFYRRALTMVRFGNFKPGEYYGGLHDGTVSIAPLHADVPDTVRALVARRTTELIDGRFDYWRGPLKNNARRLVVAPGATVTIADIHEMKWLLDTVDGTLPK